MEQLAVRWRETAKIAAFHRMISAGVGRQVGWHAGCFGGRWVMRNGRGLRVDGRAAGFTLIELMITVAIIGVLAILATAGYSKWILTSKTAEAPAMLGAIKSAQEVFRAERLRYLDVSVGSLDTMFPAATPSSQKVKWDTGACSIAVCTNFLTLNVQAETFVYYRYSTIAGAATGAPVSYDGRTTPAANDPWFVARARGDLDGDGVLSSYYVTSFDTALGKTNADE